MIRRLEPHEIDLYRAIREEALSTDPDAFGQTLAVFTSRSEADWARRLERGMTTPGAGILVDEADGQVRGMCGFGVNRDDPTEGYLWGMFVSPTARRQGIGLRMIEEATVALTASGIRRIAARVAAPNSDALSFYEAAGFTVGEQIGTLREGSQVPVHRIEKDV